jgi:CyaY protein
MSATIDDATFRRLAEDCLERVAAWIEGFDPDEVEAASADGVLSLVFHDGARFVLNRQSAARQMWYAAGARAWHYDWDERTERWRDDRDGHELAVNLARTLSEKLGRTVEAPG